MWNLLKILCLCGCIFLQIDSGDTTRPRVINGTSINISLRPFMVSLHHKSGGFLCGGSIINEYWILTAYHCMPKGENYHHYSGRAGSKYQSKGGVIRSLSKVVYYNNTERDDLGIPKHDILLLRVKQKFRASKSIKGIKIPDENEHSPNKLWVTGWGVMGIGSNQKFPKNLQTTQLDYVDHAKCLASTKWYTETLNEDNHLCYFRDHQDACFGDSGGPLANQRKIYGIVSFGDQCGKVPGVYTRVSYYANWIRGVIHAKRRRPHH